MKASLNTIKLCTISILTASCQSVKQYGTVLSQPSFVKEQCNLERAALIKWSDSTGAGRSISNASIGQHAKPMDLSLCRCDVDDLRLNIIFKHIDPPICHLIRKLDICNNKIEDLQLLNRLVNLEELDLSSNRLKGIQGIALKKLTSLNVSRNEIKDVDEVAISQLPKLEKLDLSFNQIECVSKIRQLSNLKILKLSHNEIKEVNGFSSLSSIKELDLSNNHIERIKDFEFLFSLKELNLNHNKIGDEQLQLFSRSNWSGLTLKLVGNRIKDVDAVRRSIRSEVKIEF